MDVWDDPKANLIKGTDGSVSPPYKTREQKLNVFIPDLRRLLKLNL